jgi:hypothetical protein
MKMRKDEDVPHPRSHLETGINSYESNLVLPIIARYLGF